METGEGDVHEWKIENLSHWCAEVHGDCIRSPEFDYYPCIRMELYPKGIGGQGEHLVVRLRDLKFSFPGELSFHSSDGSLLCSKQQMYAEQDTDLELPPGPKFEDVLSRIRDYFITVRLRIQFGGYNSVRRVSTTINVTKISLKMNPEWFEEMKSNETKDFFYIQLSPNGILDRMWLKVCSENDTVHFRIQPPTDYEDSFAVEMSLKGTRFDDEFDNEMSLTGSDVTVDRCSKKEHVFRYDNSPWTFPESLQKKELEDGLVRISLLLCLKTRDLFLGSFHMNCAYSCVSIAPNNTICFSVEEPPTNDSVLVLTEELMCLYQDQDFSDITLKCDNVSFPVHKNVLSARSPVFKAMLFTDMAEAASGEVDIGDLDPSTLSRFLTYLYTGTVEEDLQCDRALKLYYAADKYQVPSLKRDCSKFLCANLSVSNVCDILSFADRHGDDQLTSEAQEFILDNYNDVSKSNEWESFRCREPLLAEKTVPHFASIESVVRKPK